MSEFTSILDESETTIHSLLVEWKQRGLDREKHHDPDRNRYTSDEQGTVADELELIAVSKLPTTASYCRPYQPGTFGARGDTFKIDFVC